MNSFARGAFNTGLIILGIFSATFGLKGFLLSSHFIDGGVTGISMLLASALGFPLAILIFVINLPFIAIGYKQIGKAENRSKDTHFSSSSYPSIPSPLRDLHGEISFLENWRHQ